jgi:hypothetical protein
VINKIDPNQRLHKQVQQKQILKQLNEQKRLKALHCEELRLKAHCLELSRLEALGKNHIQIHEATLPQIHPAVPGLVREALQVRLRPKSGEAAVRSVNMAGKSSVRSSVFCSGDV